jgi:hypothetical protein
MTRRFTAVATRLTVVAVACVAVLAFAPTKASATPVLWTFNVTQSAGGTVVGSFVYDADTNVYSSVAITTTLPTATFDTSDIATTFSGVPSATNLILIDGFVPGANNGKPDLSLAFSPALTNLGGSASASGFDGICFGSGCGSVSVSPNGGGISGQISGTPVASAVPEPATLFLCSAGLVGLRRWRQGRA